jgi:WD40 repeat protein
MKPFPPVVLAALLSLPAFGEEEKDRFQPTRLAFAPDSKTLAVVGYVGKKPLLELWHVAARRQVWRVSLDAATSTGVVWPDGKTLLVASGPAVLEIDPATGKTRRTLAKHGDKVVAMALTRDGKTLATAADDRTIQFRDWKADRVVAKGASEVSPIYGIAFSPDGKRAVTAQGKAAVIWDAADGTKRGILKPNSSHLAAGLFRGEDVITGSWDGVIRVYEGAEVKLRFHGPGGVDALALDDARHRLAAIGSGHTIALYDVSPGPPDAATAGRIKALLEKLDDDSYEAREAASRDFKGLGFIAEKALREAAEGSPSAEVRIRARVLRHALFSEYRSLNGHTGRTRAITFSPDGKTLASCAEDGTVRLWDPATGKETAKLP